MISLQTIDGIEVNAMKVIENNTDSAQEVIAQDDRVVRLTKSFELGIGLNVLYVHLLKQDRADFMDSMEDERFAMQLWGMRDTLNKKYTEWLQQTLEASHVDDDLSADFLNVLDDDFLLLRNCSRLLAKLEGFLDVYVVQRLYKLSERLSEYDFYVLIMELDLSNSPLDDLEEKSLELGLNEKQKSDLQNEGEVSKATPVSTELVGDLSDTKPTEKITPYSSLENPKLVEAMISMAKLDETPEIIAKLDMICTALGVVHMNKATQRFLAENYELYSTTEEARELVNLFGQITYNTNETMTAILLSRFLQMKAMKGLS